MARMKAVQDARQRKYETEAALFVKNYLKQNNINVDDDDIFIIWFAFTNHGYRCMVTSRSCKDLFFEISKNNKTKEFICHCFKQFEYIVYPSKTDSIELHDRLDSFVS